MMQTPDNTQELELERLRETLGDAPSADLHGDDTNAMPDAADSVVVVSVNGSDEYSVQVMSAEDALHMVEANASPETVAALHSLFSARNQRGSTENGMNTKADLAHRLRQPLPTVSTRPEGHRTRSREFLSVRESQIVSMIGSGKTVGMIAEELGLSVKTVSTYRTRALEKMGLKTNADLIRYVIEQSVAAAAA